MPKENTTFSMKIYTKTGDSGETGLSDGMRYRKSDDVFWLIGDIDELCAWIGACEAKFRNSKLESRNKFKIQKSKKIQTMDSQMRKQSGTELDVICESLHRICEDLFTVNSVLARAKNIKFDSKRETEWLEGEIDKMTLELPELRNFILPGGSEIASFLHLARAVCRRVERRFVMFQYGNMIEQKRTKEILPFFNRLSDYFFTLVRFSNFKMGKKEEIWKM